jgi:hypothetical protein
LTQAFPSLELRTEFFKPMSRPQGGSRATNGLAFRNTFSGARPGCLLMARMRCGETSFISSERYTLHNMFTLPPFLGGGVAVGMYEVGKMYNAPGVSKTSQ